MQHNNITWWVKQNVAEKMGSGSLAEITVVCWILSPLPPIDQQYIDRVLV